MSEGDAAGHRAGADAARRWAVGTAGAAVLAVGLVISPAAGTPGPAVPAPAPAVQKPPVGWSVTPSSCPGGDAPLAYGTQPVLTADFPDASARFEVWPEGRTPSADVPTVGGVVTAAPGRPSWQVPAGALARGTTYSWRARPDGDGTRWSGWRAFTVNTDLPEVAECRVDGQALLGLSFRAGDDGVDLTRAVDDYGWQDPFGDLALELAAGFPGDFTGWGISDDPRRGWLGFSAAPPAAAVGRIDAFRARPVARTATIEVRTGAGYTDAELARRMYAALGAVLRQFDKVVDADAGTTGTTGLISLTVARHPDYHAPEAEMAEALRQAIQAETSVRIVPADGTTHASATVQPVAIRVLGR